ncbi:MAG: hypothetical protein LUO80_10790 [Methylococcaceae bacterium]|nr:hypothetical protein [Methylococcaceae bacterium]
MWLLRQAYKEYWDGFIPPLERMQRMVSGSDSASIRQAALADAYTATEEYAHYCFFADAYDALQGDARLVKPEVLREAGDWAENEYLMDLRRAHKAQYGDLGERAHRFTEGGYCTLYREGMKLQGRGGIDDIIARACAAVYEDEFDHMLMGIAGLEAKGIADSEWEILAALSTEQMRYRIRMRNAQFGYPLSEQQVQALCDGAAEPLPFDYPRAGMQMPDEAGSKSRL